MKKIITVEYLFDPGDRVIYTGPICTHNGTSMLGAAGTILGEANDSADYAIMWDGWTEPDDVDKADVRPIEER